MRRFERILVGVDLSRRDRLVGKELNSHSSRAYESAISLARLSGAQLHFLYSLEVSVDAQHRIERDRGMSPTLLDIAEDRMKILVDDALREGLKATGSVVFGRSWLSIIREVLREGHDLVMVGTRQLGAVKSLLLGSIGIQLIRKCPCPVWISKATTASRPVSILLANDRTRVGHMALEFAAGLAELHGSDLHVLHSLEGYSVSPGQPSEFSVEDVAATEKKIGNRLRESGLTQRAHIRLASASSFCSAVSDHVRHYGHDLLVLGTQAGDGISRMIKRERAERLLSRVPCSLLAVKPASLFSTVAFDELESPQTSIGAA